MLRVENLTKRFGSRTVLNAVSVKMPARSVNFLMGPNGAGKTTMIRCVLGLHRYQGQITWDGSPLDPSERRVCPVFDEAPFHLRLTGSQNLQVLLPESVGGPTDYLSHDALRRKVRGYSHGERTRLALMAALDSGAELVIPDEPTNGLDRDTMQRLKADIRARAASMTFVIAGHNLEFYDDVIDNLFVLEGGRVSLVASQPDHPGRRMDLARVYDEHFPPVEG
ncbi:MAG: ATP-binding cassette domain-containing protein [Candidatus Nanopelagicales bacterium]